MFGLGLVSDCLGLGTWSGLDAGFGVRVWIIARVKVILALPVGLVGIAYIARVMVGVMNRVKFSVRGSVRARVRLEVGARITLARPVGLISWLAFW